MKKESSLIKSTFIIMIVSVISRAVGFIRDMLIAQGFGAGMYTDAYNIAVTIPETIFTLIGLAISTAFLPMLSKIRAKKGQKEMYNFANNVVNILFVISMIFFVLSSIFSKEIVHILAGGFSEEALILATRLTRITLLNILFLSINACFTSLLQVNEDFVIPSILGLFFNLPMIVYLLIFRKYDIVGLTIANVIGNFLRVVVQIPSLLSHGYKFKFFINIKDKRIHEILILIIPVIIGAGANSLNMIVDKKIASSLAVGSISALDYGQKLIVFINAIITTSIANVAYPIMANMRNNGDENGFVETLKKSIIYLAILLIPITVGVLIFGCDIVQIVYGRGQFDEYAVRITSAALIGYGSGIFFTGMRDILNSTLFSMGKTKITTFNGVVGVLFNILFNLVLSKYFGVLGIAIASVSSMIITSMLLFRSVIKIEHNFKIGDLISKILIISLNSIVMGLVIILFVMFIGTKLNTVATVVLGTTIGIIVYFILGYILKIQELIELKNIILAKIKK
ncbi:MAG: murein biosynthesis integral membrane protein MurJ [Clostridium sp.]|uniref:murein biosynthesis integral membrane protein MurJ n=1 Tax=Clostridium TaxID=1485 RepID=UPI000DEB3D36|nr:MULTISPECIES: murein biosynthesis integral membrane protein MurJ [Clostridium]AXB84120.1 murein biosynthesis integral membrane protein MurJ [Clostridium butyricum]MDB2155718.1 murein biosynthesis integral membrane protein MurJ [Clostridium butyricum]MDU1228657.1 murein biosynthesis integral membrane protein MurJ [Clostridium sp.]MDU3087927.1 murein biosynthesis integral membrane protein MurJ [Clostridium sp.]MDU5103281.1 murein biosynthesis integral membrane protein MurJ [Clostridium butyri